MEALHCGGDFFDIVRQFRPIWSFLAQSLECSHGEEGPPAFARAHEPFAGDGFGLALSRSHDQPKGNGREPEIHFVAQRAEIETSRAIIARKVDIIPDPIKI